MAGDRASTRVQAVTPSSPRPKPTQLQLSLSIHLGRLSSRPGTLHDFHSHEIAEQLTLLDAELFYKIEVRVGQGSGRLACP